MKIKEILTMHGIKHRYITDQMNITKAGFSQMLSVKMPEKREKEIRQILKTTAISLLDCL